MSSVLETAAREVFSGAKTLDAAIAEVAKATKRSSQQVREQMTEAVAALKEQADQQKAAAEAAKAETKSTTPKEPRPRLEHVEPAQFAEVRDRLGLTNKEVASALLGVVGNKEGVPPTLSRITELTHSKGASVVIFNKYVEALEAFRAAHPVQAAEAVEA